VGSPCNTFGNEPASPDGSALPASTASNCCADGVLTGCWFRGDVTFPGKITDFTTWSANIAGDPVRLTK
jgi:hypothetical protein